MRTNPISVQPGQVLGFRPARRHEKPGLYPIFAIAGGSEPPNQPPAPPADPPAPPTPPAPPAPTPPAPPAPAADAPQKVEDLPEWAQKLVGDLRKEAGDNRVGKTELEQRQAELLKSIGTALGLTTGDEPPDPAKLTEQLTAAQAAQREAGVKLAVFQTAGKHQGDPAALLDSNSFLAKVRDLDPTASDFATKVETAIMEAVAANPKLKTGQAPGASSVDHSGRPGGEGRSDQPKSLSDAVATHYGTGG